MDNSTLQLFKLVKKNQGINETTFMSYIEAGANVNALNNKGQGLLHLLLEYLFTETNNTIKLKYIRCISILLSNGANPNILSGDRLFTPLILLSKFTFNDDLIRMYNTLISNGADINFTGFSKMNALMYALIRTNHLQHIQFLLDQGVSLNALDDYEENSLVYAVTSEYCSPTIIKLLLDKGVWINVVPSNNIFDYVNEQTPEEYREEVKQLILLYVDNPNNKLSDAILRTQFNVGDRSMKRSEMSVTADDIINGTDENMKVFISENPRHKIIKFNNQYRAFDADTYYQQYINKEKKNENKFFICKLVLTGLAVSENQVELDRPLISLRMLGLTGYILMSDFVYILLAPHQYFEIITDEFLHAISITSYEMIYGRGGFPGDIDYEAMDSGSSSHCQEGQESNVYNIAILNVEEDQYGGLKKKKTKKNIKKKYKKSYKKI
jgi:Ankyrin repeats (3 copies)